MQLPRLRVPGKQNTQQIGKPGDNLVNFPCPVVTIATPQLFIRFP